MWRTSRTWTLGFLILPVFQLVSGIDQASAEVSGPFTTAAVDSTLAHYSPQAQVSGTFKVQGSETMYPLLSRLSLEFQRRQPKVAIDVRGRRFHEGHCRLFAAAAE